MSSGHELARSKRFQPYKGIQSDDTHCLNAFLEPMAVAVEGVVVASFVTQEEER